MPSLLSHATLVLAPVLIAALWQAALLALATAMLLHLLPTLSAAARSRIWNAAFLLAAILPFTALFPSRHDTTYSHTEFHAAFALAVALVAIWCVTSAARAVQLLRGAIHLRGIARRATPISSHENAGAQVCTSSEVDVPSVAGFLHPRILIPATLYPTLSAPELHHILLHEAEHLRRRDDWTNLLQKIALVLFPISPALLWMERRLCLERELACDDGVLRATGATRAYATTLTNLAERGFLRHTLSLALGAIRHRSEVARRVHRILARPAAEMSPRRAALASTLALAGIAATGFTFARVPQLVAFTPRPAAVTSLASAASVDRPSILELPARMDFRPTLVRAIMPAPHPLFTAFHSKRTGAHVAHRTKPSVKIVSIRNENAPRIVRTSHQAPIAAVLPEFRITRVRFTEDALPRFQIFTYAAVPVRSGWLILQL